MFPEWDIFNTEFSELLSNLQSIPGKHIVLGDFNFHVNDPEDAQARKFTALIEQYNFSQHVTFPTHDAGNTLDLVITRKDLTVSNISIDQSVKSDHHAVILSLSSVSPGVTKRSITYRKWRSVNVDSVREDISSVFADFAVHDLDSAVRTYNTALGDIIKKHAPEKSRVVDIREDSPWYNSDLAKEKRLRRKLERKFNTTKLVSDKVLLQEQRNKYNFLLTQTKKDYFRSKVESATSSKELYKVCDKLLNREKASVLPTHDCAKSLADRFIFQ